MPSSQRRMSSGPTLHIVKNTLALYIGLHDTCSNMPLLGLFNNLQVEVKEQTSVRGAPFPLAQVLGSVFNLSFQCAPFLLSAPGESRPVRHRSCPRGEGLFTRCPRRASLSHREWERARYRTSHARLSRGHGVRSLNKSIPYRFPSYAMLETKRDKKN